MSDESAFKVLTRKCPNCGAKIPFDAGENYVCQYCDTPLTIVTPATSSQPGPESGSSADQVPSKPKAKRRPEMDFERQTDPTEGAFSLMVPQNWQTTGGVERTKAASWLGAFSPKSPAKTDFTVMNDAQATVAIRWLPDIVYVDMQSSASGMIVGAMYPTGSKYSGLTVSPVLSATQFLNQMLLPMVHSQAQQVDVIEQRPLPTIAQGYQQRMTALNSTSTYDAGMIVATYEEKGVHFKESIFTIIENTGRAGDGKWGNKETLLVRTPENAYDEWLSTFSTIQQSVELDSQWLMNEVKAQFNITMAMLPPAHVQIFVQGLIQNHQATKAAVNAELFKNAA